jgi:S1-C subfamily serine protease
VASGSKGRIVAAAIVVLVIAASLGWVYLSTQQVLTQQSEKINQLTESLQSLERQISTLTQAIQNRSTAYSVDFALLYSEVKDSVVVVQGVMVQRINTIFGPVLQYTDVQGSGFVCNETGRVVIITNFHVIDQVQNLTVTLSDGNAFNAQALGTDAYSDIAVLEISAPISELKPLELASSLNLQVGDPVIAVGTPLGLTGSMTTGIVSQLGRTIEESSTGGYSIANVIQTSVAINAGNSGGPLLNSLGEVVGVTTAIISGTQGIGLAIPSDTILRELPSLISNGTYGNHPWIGISGVDVTPDIAKALNLQKTYGWLVTSVTTGGPAEKAGIRGGTKQVRISGSTVIAGGDVIIALNGTRIRNGDDLSAYLEAYTLPGETVQVTILRNNVEQTIPVVLGKRP